MTSVRRLETRLSAWRSFRGVARASRTLAAAQSLYWAEQLGRIERWLIRVDELAVAYPRPPRSSDQSVALVIGTDLGLCGPLNTQIAAAAEPVLAAAELAFVVGQRLEGIVDTSRAVHLGSPTSFAAVQSLAATIDTLLGPDAEQTDLTVVVATGVLPDGAPVVETLTDREPRSGRTPPSPRRAVPEGGPERDGPTPAAARPDHPRADPRRDERVRGPLPNDESRPRCRRPPNRRAGAEPPQATARDGHPGNPRGPPGCKRGQRPCERLTESENPMSGSDRPTRLSHPEPPRPNNLADYDRARADFAWADIRAELGSAPERINIAYAAVDRHVDVGKGDVTAIRWQGKRGETKTITYADLAERSRRFASALQSLGVGAGDRVFSLLGRRPRAVPGDHGHPAPPGGVLPAVLRVRTRADRHPDAAGPGLGPGHHRPPVRQEGAPGAGPAPGPEARDRDRRRGTRGHRRAGAPAGAGLLTPSHPRDRPRDPGVAALHQRAPPAPPRAHCTSTRRCSSTTPPVASPSTCPRAMSTGAPPTPAGLPASPTGSLRR